MAANMQTQQLVRLQLSLYMADQTRQGSDSLKPISYNHTFIGDYSMFGSIGSSISLQFM